MAIATGAIHFGSIHQVTIVARGFNISLAIGFQLGQPVPESNFVSSKQVVGASGASVKTLSSLCQYWPVNARSVPF
jgi:hypothetical protein